MTLLDEPTTATPSASTRPRRAAGPRWIDVCSVDDLDIDRGVGALIDGRPVAIFRCSPWDELFAVNQMIEANPSLRGALADHSRSAEDRSGLLLGLLGGKTLPATAVLVGQAVTRERGTVESALQEFIDLAAAALSEGVATVTTARELSQDEQQRLTAALAQQYGKDVQLHVVVDASLIGGLRVEIGDDVIDGTVLSRLDEARRRLAG
jgi:F-type H+-transporting ATPase subunit delta